MKTAYFILLLSLLPVFGKACGCDTVPFDNAINADEIFLGEFYKREVITYSDSYYDSFQGKEIDYEESDDIYYFKIIRKWKGGNSNIAVIRQPSSCAFPFDFTNLPYLIYGYYDNEWLFHFERYLHGKPLGTYCGTRNARASYYGFSEDNWFDSDTTLLNQKFPHPIKLVSYKKRWIGGAIGFVVLLGAGLMLLRKWRKRRTHFFTSANVT